MSMINKVNIICGMNKGQTHAYTSIFFINSLEYIEFVCA